MYGWKVITRTLLSMTFRKRAGARNSPSALVGFIVLAAILSACIAVALGFLGAAVRDYDLTTEIAALLLAADFMLTLVFGTVAVFSYMYFSRDNEFLMSLPVRPGTVFAAKLTVIYVEEAAVGAVLAFPGAIVLGIATAQGAAFYIMTLIAVALVPLCALLLGALIAVPLTFIAGFFRNRGAVASVLLLVLFAAFMTVYIVVVNLGGRAPASGGAEDIGAAVETLRAAVRRSMYVIYPIYCLARFGTNGGGFAEAPALSAAINLIVFLGTVVALSAALVPLASLMYRRAVMRQSENPPRSRNKAGRYERSGVLRALVKKETRMLIRNSSFAFQCLAGVVLSPVMCIVMMIMGNGEGVEEAGISGLMFVFMWAIAAMIALMMTCALNFTALTAVTREGVTFAYSKLIPVPYTVQLDAKRVVSVLPPLVSCAVSVAGMAVSGAVALKTVDVAAIISTLVMLAAGVLCFTEFYLRRDLKKPRLDWVTPRDAVKSNPATVIPTLLGILAAFGAGGVILGLGLGLYFAGLGGWGLTIASAALAAVFVLLFFIVRGRTTADADRLYAALSV